MSFNISIESNLKQFQKQLSALEQQAYPKAVTRTLNRVASSAKTASAKHIAPMMNAKQSDIKRRMIEAKAYPRKVWASIIASGSPLKLIAFKARQTTRGVVAKAWGRTKLYRGTFIAPVKHGSSTNAVYVRRSQHSLPVKQLYGPGVAQLFKQQENITIMQDTVRMRLSTEFKNNINYYASRIKR
ncbi:MAG: phage tail protein [Rickettsiales bacterium]